jgi:hypothetical protein
MYGNFLVQPPLARRQVHRKCAPGLAEADEKRRPRDIQASEAIAICRSGEAPPAIKVGCVGSRGTIKSGAGLTRT